jgi:sugar fermentation stimulation protein A
LMFCVQHSGIQTVQSAAEIDPVYAAVLKEAQEVGVEVYAYGCRLSEMGIVVAKPLLFIAG